MKPDEGAIQDGAHVFPLRVYYEDTDNGGMVYYANYLCFAERARTEMLRAVGFEHGGLAADHGIAFTVRRCEADFRRPARLDDTLQVRTENLDITGAGLWADQIILRGDEVLVSLRIQLACIGSSGRPTRLPGALRTALKPLAATP
ncbi:MAG: tol-pal system-associated acyl-CoA thioesterase [Alphaproteobacteria bacterium]